MGKVIESVMKLLRKVKQIPNLKCECGSEIQKLRETQEGIIRRINRIENILPQITIIDDRNLESDISAKISLLNPVNIDGINLQRFGSLTDGGYVVSEWDSKLKSILISIGIGDNYEFEKQMSNLVSIVYSYDHTIEDLPDNYRNLLNFRRVGLSYKDDNRFTTLESIYTDVSIDIYNHRILKMDIEGNEWDILNKIESIFLAKIDQLIIEFHDLCETEDHQYQVKVIEKILETHVPIYWHCNNHSKSYCGSNLFVTDCLEVTFLNKESIKGKKVVPTFNSLTPNAIFRLEISPIPLVNSVTK